MEALNYFIQGCKYYHHFEIELAHSNYSTFDLDKDEIDDYLLPSHILVQVSEPISFARVDTIDIEGNEYLMLYVNVDGYENARTFIRWFKNGEIIKSYILVYDD
ncbi:hypothetical protein [Lysinibacillus sphaericus]|uniref:hypothetical protein n=1 Tax=Lysinibacillus sphaericus TaxID=1421 RepID=UPI001CBF6514|nr:hypothetical protein [Lysinibacillus sphaericus]